MSDEIAIKVDGVSKSFKLPHEKHSSIKGAIVNIGRTKRGYEKQHVLKNVSFEIKKGEFFGIVGRNGSGKSTLLKLLAGIYATDKGTITVNGKLTPFIELGVGFNPELSGRENVFLNGALLGFNRKEMTAMYDEIVEFAELERFMDQKLKNYSSGMQVRLAFSIAIQANSEILLLDEVLAVGDEAFQRKCHQYFSKLKKSNTTVVLVTHDMGAVQRFCDKAMLISNGEIVKFGSPEKVADMYSRENDDAYAETKEVKRSKSIKAGGFNITIENGRGEGVKRFFPEELVVTRVVWEDKNARYIGIALVDAMGRDVFSPNTYQERVKALSGNQIKYTFKANLSPGEYHLKAAIFGENDRDLIDRIAEGPTIIIEKNKDSESYVGVTRLEHTWEE